MIGSLNLIDFVIFIINITHFVCHKSCDISYKYNYTNEMCEYFACSADTDCKYEYWGTICLKQKCVCSDDFYETTEFGRKVCFPKTLISKRCDKLGDCGLNQFCWDNTCECKPSYRYRTNSCEYDPCFSCERFDSNRNCTHRFSENNTIISECKCKWGFSVDPNTLFCNLTTKMSCTYNSDCIQYSNDMVCVDKICECKPNFEKNDIWNECRNYYCKNDSECQQYDKHRICEQNICRCDDDYSEDSYDKKCYKFNWLWLLPILPLLLVVLIVYRKYSSRSQQSNQDIDSPPTYTEVSLSMISQNFPIHDPPPAYSTNFSNNYHLNNINRSPELIQNNQIQSNHLENAVDSPPPYSIK